MYYHTLTFVNVTTNCNKNFLSGWDAMELKVVLNFNFTGKFALYHLHKH